MHCAQQLWYASLWSGTWAENTSFAVLQATFSVLFPVLASGNTLHLYISSSGKCSVILVRWNAEQQLLFFCQWRPLPPEGWNCKQVWGSSHILLSFPFLTYMFQSQPPARRWREWTRSSSPPTSHCTIANWSWLGHLMEDGVTLSLLCACFFMNWNLREHENQMVTQAHRRTGSLLCRWKKGIIWWDWVLVLLCNETNHNQ